MSANPYPDQSLSTLLILLSLDGVVPLYEEMGVPAEDRRALALVVRKTIVENRRLWASSSEQRPALRALLLSNIQSEFGPEAARAFSRWAGNVFAGDHAAQPQWSAWEIVFSNWAFNQQLWLKGLPEEKQEALLRAYVEKTSLEDLRPKIERLKSRTLSEWDLDMYARHGYGVDEFADPYLVVEMLVKVRRLQQFWCEAAPGLTEEETEILRSEGQEVIDRLGVWMPGPLRSLDELGEDVC